MFFLYTSQNLANYKCICFGGVCVAHRCSFLCCVFFVLLFCCLFVFVSCLCLWIVQSQFSPTFIYYTEETKLTVLFHIWIMLFYLCHPFHTNHTASNDAYICVRVPVGSNLLYFRSAPSIMEYEQRLVDSESGLYIMLELHVYLSIVVWVMQ